MKRENDVPDPLLEQAVMIARSGDFLADWPGAPAHSNPVTAAVVVGWFRNAFKAKLTLNEADVRTLVRWLNHAGPWDSDNVDKMTTLSAEYNKLSEAIDTILEYAPDFLELAVKRSRQVAGKECSDRMRHEWHDRRVRTLRALLMGARAAAEEFPVSPKNGKKRSPFWRSTARSAATFIASAMLQAGHRGPNFNGGPALEVLQRAVHHLEGKERPLDQLRGAFRSKKIGSCSVCCWLSADAGFIARLVGRFVVAAVAMAGKPTTTFGAAKKEVIKRTRSCAEFARSFTE